jgi:transcriptional regulator with XRE-family HTH domain
MGKKAAERQQTKFAAWLASEMASHGMNQRDLAEKVGVSNSTVNRWLGSRIPAARYAERIADALLATTDEVLERAGYRPHERRQPADGERGKLVSMVRRVRLDRTRRKILRNVLEAMLEEDQETRQPAETVARSGE